jgi:hypothetical protein
MNCTKRNLVLLLAILAAAKLLSAQVAANLTSNRPGNPLQSASSRTGLLLRDDVTRSLIQNSSGDLADDYVSQPALWDRTRATQGFRAAAEMGKWTLEALLRSRRVAIEKNEPPRTKMERQAA